MHHHPGSPYHGSDDDRRAASLTAVAIDRDKNSQHAVKWTVDHLLLNNPNVILIHVKNKSFTQGFSMVESGPDGGREQADAEIQQLFLPFRGFCARKGVLVREVVLEEADVSKALNEFICSNGISNIVLGASNRNAITKKFRNPDVPSCLMKAAPDFCTVYVISKGKVLNVRSASRPPPPPRPVHHPAHPPQSPAHDLDHDGSVRAPVMRGSWRAPASPGPAYVERRSFERGNDYMKTPTRPTGRSIPTNNVVEGGSMDLSLRAPRSSNPHSFSEDLDYVHGFRSSDFNADSLEKSGISSDSPRISLSSQAGALSRDLEAEMKRLKLELKQTMDLYSTACKEALSAQQKVKREC